MKKLAIVTATRAEYGLLYPLIKELRKSENSTFAVELIVTGTHLAEEYGKTVDNIRTDGIRIDKEIPISVNSSDGVDIACNQAEVLRKFAQLFVENKYEAVIILGDRYEMLMVAIAATDMKVPIIHLYGGDTTEGAIDECIRHSITKMSFLHFASNEDSRRRIIQLGENPNTVFNFGALGADNVINIDKFSKKDVLESIGLEETSCYALCTYHPVTLESINIEKQVMDFLDALCEFSDMEFIITKSNSDQGGALINAILDRESEKRDNIHVFASLGIKRYLSLMKYSEMVIGNSSSGILEAPVLRIPTVNIGDRQKGRLQTKSIINCAPERSSIVSAIRKASTKEMREVCNAVICPYGDGTASQKIAKKILEVLNAPILLKKQFFDLY